MDILRPTVKRDLSLFSITAWELGYQKYLEEYFGWKYPVIFHYDGTRVNFYHRTSDFRYFKETITERLKTDDQLFKIMNDDFCERIRRLKELVNEVSPESLRMIHKLIGKVMSFYIFVVSDAFVAARPDAWYARNISEGILYELDGKIEVCLERIVEKRGLHRKCAHVLTWEDVSMLQSDEVTQRLDGYIWYEGTLYEKNIHEFCAARGFMLPETEQCTSGDTISGQCAYPGIAQGRVRIVRNKHDLDAVREGEILVATMTNAMYTPAFGRAAAVVTDEGGVTCHAAICAREMKKPTVTGTRLATNVFKDGDSVEVDATHGLVKRVSVN